MLNLRGDKNLKERKDISRIFDKYYMSGMKQLQQLHFDKLQVRTDCYKKKSIIKSNMQQRIFNEPIIAQFFQQIPHHEKYTTLKELLLLGINAINMRITKHHYPSYQNLTKRELVAELQEMRKKIDGLAEVLNAQETAGFLRSPVTQSHKQETSFKPIVFKEDNNNDFQKNIVVNHSEVRGGEHKENITPKVTEIVPMTQSDVFVKPNSLPKNREKCMSRHHLDDSEVRKALINPFAKDTPTKKNKKDKQYIYQEEVDKQQMKIIHASYQQNSEALGKSKRSRVSQGPPAVNTIRAESKIKSLVAKDKMKYKQSHNSVDFHKYEYSSEEDDYEEEGDEVSKIEEVAEKQESSNGRSFSNTGTVPQLPKQPKQSFQREKQTIQYSQHQSYDTSQQESLRNPKSKQTNRINQSKDESSDYSDFRYEGDQFKRNNRFFQEEAHQEESSDSDAVSQSSSFSKFSLGSQREVGKIGVRR